MTTLARHSLWSRINAQLRRYVAINPRSMSLETLPQWLLIVFGRDRLDPFHRVGWAAPYQLFVAVKPHEVPEGEILNGWRVWHWHWAPVYKMRTISVIVSATKLLPRFTKHHR